MWRLKWPRFEAPEAGFAPICVYYGPKRAQDVCDRQSDPKNSGFLLTIDWAKKGDVALRSLLAAWKAKIHLAPKIEDTSMRYKTYIYIYCIYHNIMRVYILDTYTHIT